MPHDRMLLAVYGPVFLRDVAEGVKVILDAVPDEVAGLRRALVEGRIDGTMYTGSCACLIGTVANLQGVDHRFVPGLKPNPEGPVEVFTTSIRPGHTPQTSPHSAFLVECIDEWSAQFNGEPS